MREPEYEYDIIVVGGGSAGLAAAISAYEEGRGRILLLERDHELGGILLQCIHNGFGLHTFKEELSGPTYAERYIDRLRTLPIAVRLDAMVIGITPDRDVTYVTPSEGTVTASARAVVLAMGCRERTRGAIRLPGFRPAGIWTAGTAQRYINMEGFMVGRRVLILGSGDIGLIMARRMALVGAQVLAVAELMPYSNGLARNRKQCLDDFAIPLLLSHTVVDIRGKDRLESVGIARVDDKLQPIAGTEQTLLVDTLLLSVGLIPENDLVETTGVEICPRTRGAVVSDLLETSIPGIFSCGNVLHVHDLVDFVSEEGEKAGRAAARYAAGQVASGDTYAVTAGDGISQILPHRIRVDREPADIEFLLRVNREYRGASIRVIADGETIATFRRPVMAPAETEKVLLRAAQLVGIKTGISFSVVTDSAPSAFTRNVGSATTVGEGRSSSEEMICIVCPVGCRLRVRRDDDGALHVTGNSCPRGDVYARNEVLAPMRTVTATVRIRGARYPRLPVITAQPIPKDKIFSVMEAIGAITLEAPVASGAVILQDVAGTGVDIVAERSMPRIKSQDKS